MGIYASPDNWRTCYKCGLPGHIRRDCDCKQKSVAEMRQHSSHDWAAVCELVSDKHTCPIVNQQLVDHHGGVQLKCGCEVPYAGCLMVGHTAGVPQKRLDVVQGRVGDQVVSCLRDTGALQELCVLLW